MVDRQMLVWSVTLWSGKQGGVAADSCTSWRVAQEEDTAGLWRASRYEANETRQRIVAKKLLLFAKKLLFGFTLLYARRHKTWRRATGVHTRARLRSRTFSHLGAYTVPSLRTSRSTAFLHRYTQQQRETQAEAAFFYFFTSGTGSPWLKKKK